MNVSKVGLCTINDLSNVTMISEDGVIAEMIIEVDDETEPETHQPFSFELDEDEDEIYPSGLASPRSHQTGHVENHNLMHNGHALFTLKDSNGGTQTDSGAEKPDIQVSKSALGLEPVTKNILETEPVTKTVINSEYVISKSVKGSREETGGCVATDETSGNKPKQKCVRKLLPKSNMVTRHKAAAHQVSEDTSKGEETEIVTAEIKSKEDSSPNNTISATVVMESDRSNVKEAVVVETKFKNNGDTTKKTNTDVTLEPVMSDFAEAATVESKEDSSKTFDNVDTIAAVESSQFHVAEKSNEHNEINDPPSQESEMNYESTDIDEQGKKSDEQVSGCGEMLVNISYVQHAIQHARRLTLSNLYKVINGRRVPRDMELLRDRLLQFNGFPFEENSVEYVRKMKTLKMFSGNTIKHICNILGIQVGTKVAMDHDILKFLLNPRENPNYQYLVPRYQPQVRLERLPEELLKFEKIQAKSLEMIQHQKKEEPTRKCRKRKAAEVESSEVRLTRSAKRLMQHDEEGEKSEENSIPCEGKTVVRKSRELRNLQIENKPHRHAESTNSENCRREVKNKRKVSYFEGSEDETDEDIGSQETLDTSDEQSDTCKGTQGRRSLGDFIEIRQNIEKCDVKSLQNLHSILFNSLDREQNWKKNILEFSGFNFKCESSRWKRKEFVLSLMSPSKLKEIGDLLHLQCDCPKGQKSLTFTIMKFLAEPRKQMLKSSSSQKQRRSKIVRSPRKWGKKAQFTRGLDEGNSALEVKSLLQAIRAKRESDLCENSAEKDSPSQSVVKRKLADIPNVQFMIITSNYEDIDNLHQLLFLQSGPRAKIRRNVQNFDGFTFGTNSFAYKIRVKLLNKMGYEVARRIAFFLGLAPKGTTIPQQDLTDLIMHFLMCPNDIKCGSIKAYPKNFFSNYPTERPVLDITSITDAVKKSMKNTEHEKDLGKYCKSSGETKSASEMSSVDCNISGDTMQKLIRNERESPHNDVAEPSGMVENAVTSKHNNVNSGSEVNKKACVNSAVKETDTEDHKQERKKVVLSRRTRTLSRKKISTSPVSRKKRIAVRKENVQLESDIKQKTESASQQQFLFTFDSGSRFDSKTLMDYLKRSQSSVVKKPEETKTPNKELISTAKPNIPVKITPKPEVSGSANIPVKIIPKAEVYGLPTFPLQVTPKSEVSGSPAFPLKVTPKSEASGPPASLLKVTPKLEVSGSPAFPLKVIPKSEVSGSPAFPLKVSPKSAAALGSLTFPLMITPKSEVSLSPNIPLKMRSKPEVSGSPIVPLKVTSKSEVTGSPKVISILLPPPPSPQKNLPVPPDTGNKISSNISNIVCAPSFQNVTSNSLSTITTYHGGKMPIPSLCKKSVLKSTTSQPSQIIQANTATSHLTQIKLPSSVVENIKGSQIEGVIRLPQNFMINQNKVQAPLASDVLSMPEVQKCLQHINNANGKKKHVKMIKIASTNSIAVPPNALSMGGGKVFMFPVKPVNQLLPSVPVSSVVSPVQLNNHIVVTSNVECGTPTSIPQLIQVAKNYSKTIGTTALPVNNVTVAAVRPQVIKPISVPATSASPYVFPVSLTSNISIAPQPALKIQNSSEREPAQKGLIHKINPSETGKLNDAQISEQKKEDNSSDSELDEEPLSNLVGHPSDEMLLQNVKDVVVGADLSAITMRNVLQKIYDKYPQFDLTYRKSFLKVTVKKVICCAPPPKTY